MPDWLYWLLVAAGSVPLALAVLLGCAHLYFRGKFLRQIVRIFEERPLFVIPRGRPVLAAEDVVVPTTDGLRLRGCYLRGAGRRKGVVLFGLEFGSTRWAAVGYCERLLAAGYDVFACEARNQGESDKDPKYSPLQWVTDKDLADCRAALAYLKGRPDAPRGGVGVFGISKGGSVGLTAAAADPWVKCVVTDGAYAAYTTMVPYMKRWVGIYSPNTRVQELVPGWLYGSVGLAAMARSAATRGVRFLSGERAARRLRVPLLMIHGGADTYIKPDMARSLFLRAGSRDKELWLVPGAKHNQAAQVAGDEYHRRVVAFFDRHLAEPDPAGPDSGVLGAVAPPAGRLVGAAG